MGRLVRRCLAAIGWKRAEAEDDLSRELASHLALLEDENRRRGMTPDEARLAARRAMGSMALAKDRHRDARSFAWIDDAWRDLGFAARMLARGHGFTAVVVLTMAISIGATTTLFSLAYGVLMRPLPWSEPDRLVRLEETRGGRPGRVPRTISNATYLAWRDQPSTIEGLGGWSRSRLMTLASQGEPERVLVGSVTTSLMRVLGVRPHIGRVFADSDDTPGALGAVVLGFGLWQRAFGGRDDAVGMSIQLDGQPYIVIGVMPRGFVFPDRETAAWTRFAVVPVQRGDDVISVQIFTALARLRPGVTPEQASAEGTARALGAPDVKQAGTALFGGNGPPAVTARSAREVMTAEVRPALVMLLAAVGLLFLASTASLVVLQLSRVSVRTREIAVRTAIGAGRARLVRQWLVESCLLGAAGATSGLLLAALLHRLLPGALPAGFPRVDDVRLDWRVAAFACGVALLASLASGMVPAFRTRRHDLAGTLGGGPAPTTMVTRTPAARVRTAFMAGQVAVACVLLVGAVLLIRSFSALVAADRGFDPSGLLTMRLPQPPKTIMAERAATLDRLHARLSALPAVTDVAFGDALPFVSPGRALYLYLPDNPSRTAEVQSSMRVVSPEYFRALRLRIAEGRALSAADTESSFPSVVVNRTFAARYLADRAVGQRLEVRFGDHDAWDVVGVVDDMRQGTNAGGPSSTFGGVLDPPEPEMFVTHRQWQVPSDDIVIVIRSSGDPAALAADARAIVRAEAPTQPVDSVMTMDERVAASLAGPRSYAVFLVGFALCALVVAGVGLFGVLSYTVAQRTREIGVRTALGASRRNVLALVGRQALVVTAIGLTTGLLAAFFLAESLSALIYGISARDAVSFLSVPLVLVAVAAAACAVPAWRAVRIDPLAALRE